MPGVEADTRPEAAARQEVEKRAVPGLEAAAVGWRVVAASQPGSSHLRRGEACADRFEKAQAAGALILALADGAGSATHGAEGAEMAASAAVRLAASALSAVSPPAAVGFQLVENGSPSSTREVGPVPLCELVRDVLRRTAEAMREAIGGPGCAVQSAFVVANVVDVAKVANVGAPPAPSPASPDVLMAGASPPSPASPGILTAGSNLAPQASPPDPAAETAAPFLSPAGDPADFHSTLLLAVLTETSLAVGNIGDGWVVTRDRQGALHVPAAPWRGEYSNETFFLTSPGAIDDAAIAVVPAAELDAVALMSDGAAWFAIDFEQSTPRLPLFEKLFAFARDPGPGEEEKDRELAAFLASPVVCGKTDDDKTLMLVVRTARAAPPGDGDVR
jgi:hypothetical protein